MSGDNINDARVCRYCGYPINPGQPNHPACVDKRIADLEQALVRAEAVLGNAATNAFSVVESLKSAAYAANRISDPRNR